jgi:antitoxin HicB
MLSYPVRLTATETGSVRASFPDVPEAEAEGASEEEALARAKAVLESVLRRLFERDRKIPAPSDICGAPAITTDMFVIQETVSDWPAPISGGRR